MTKNDFEKPYKFFFAESNNVLTTKGFGHNFTTIWHPDSLWSFHPHLIGGGKWKLRSAKKIGGKGGERHTISSKDFWLLPLRGFHKKVLIKHLNLSDRETCPYLKYTLKVCIFII